MSNDNNKSENLHFLKDGCEKKLLSLLGLAARARRLIFGTDLCRDEIRRGRLPLVIVASDASPNTFKRINDACKYYNTDLCRAPIESALLSKQIGKLSNIAVVGVTDINFVNGITALFNDTPSEITAPKGRMI